MLAATLLTATFVAAIAAAANTVEDAGTSPTQNIILAGLSHSPNDMSPDVFDFLVEMNCQYSVRLLILAVSDFDFFQVEYNGARKNGSYGRECAPLNIFHSPHIDSNGSIGSVGELREYQKHVIRDELGGGRSDGDYDNSIILLVDLDVGELPSSGKVINHAKAMGSGGSQVDGLCSNGVLGFSDDAEGYYDVYSTVLLPDTFVCPVKWRSIPEVRPEEDPKLIVSSAHGEGSFTNVDLFRWFQQQGRRENSRAMNAVPVRSCFGGLAIYRASKFLDTRCSYSYGNEHEINAKYKSRNGKVSEHLVWNTCMKSVDPNFVIAVQPDMTTKYGNLLGRNTYQRSLQTSSLETSIITKQADQPTSNSLFSTKYFESMVREFIA